MADVLGICMATKNALESVQGLDRMKIIADRMNAELSRYCEKNSILAAAMSGEAELPGQATHAEVVCEQYRREHEKSLSLGICSTTQNFDFLIFKPRARPAVTSSQHMLRFFLAELRHLQYKAAAQQYDDWVNIPPIRNRDEMKKIFRRIGDFAKACAEKVLSRFEYRGLWAHAAIFNLTYQFDQNSFQTSVFEIATSLNIEFEDVLPEMRRIFAQRDSLLNSHTFKSSQDLWCRVLKEVASEHMPHAKRLLSAFLLAPPQAAACERAFAQITQLRKALGETVSPAVLEQYLRVAHMGPDDLSNAKPFLSKCAADFCRKTRRSEGRSGHGFYKKGKFLMARSRQVRSDKGKPRSSYKSRKKHAGLRGLPKARLLERDGDEVLEMADVPPDADDMSHEIFRMMSPRKKPKSDS